MNIFSCILNHMNFITPGTQKKVIAHNLSIPFENPSVGVYDFDQNGIHFARNGDVVVTRNKISENYLNFLSSCGYDFCNIKFIHADKLLPNTNEALFENDYIIKNTRNAIFSTHISSNTILDSYMLTPKEAVWANNIGTRVIGNPGHYHEFGTKSSFRALAEQNHIVIPKGYKSQSDTLGSALSAGLLFLRGAEEIVVKLDEGVAGLGSQRFTKQDFLSQFNSFKQFIENPRRVISRYKPQFVIEQWHPLIKCSPGIQLYVSQDGGVEIICTYAQLFYSHNILRYKGCLSGNHLTDDEREQVEIEGVRFAKIHADKGYRGHIAFNTIFLENDALLFVETNPRRAMSSYPHQICLNLYGDNIRHIYYRSQHMQKNTWKGKDINMIISSIASVLFSKTKKSGIVPFDYGLLFSLGRLSLVGFGSSQEEVNSLFDYVETI